MKIPDLQNDIEIEERLFTFVMKHAKAFNPELEKLLYRENANKWRQVFIDEDTRLRG